MVYMELKFLNLEEAGSTPYSDVVECGDMLYLSGLVSEDLETGDLV